MTKLTPQQLAVIAEKDLGKSCNVSFGLALMADLYIHMQDNPAEFNDNFASVVRKACTYYLENVGKSSNLASVIRQAIREEMGKLQMVAIKEEEVVEGSNGKIDDSEGFIS